MGTDRGSVRRWPSAIPWCRMRSAVDLALATIRRRSRLPSAAAVAAKIAAHQPIWSWIAALDDPDQIFSPRRRRLAHASDRSALTVLLSPA